MEDRYTIFLKLQIILLLLVKGVHFLNATLDILVDVSSLMYYLSQQLHYQV